MYENFLMNLKLEFKEKLRIDEVNKTFKSFFLANDNKLSVP